MKERYENMYVGGLKQRRQEMRNDFNEFQRNISRKGFSTQPTPPFDMVHMSFTAHANPSGEENLYKGSITFLLNLETGEVTVTVEVQVSNEDKEQFGLLLMRSGAHTASLSFVLPKYNADIEKALVEASDLYRTKGAIVFLHVMK